MRGIADWSVRHHILVAGCWVLVGLLTAISWTRTDPHFISGASIQQQTEARRSSGLIADHFGDTSRVSASVVCAADGRLILASDPDEAVTEIQPSRETVDIAQCYEAKWALSGGSVTAGLAGVRTEPQAGDVGANGAESGLLRLLLPAQIGDLATASGNPEGMSERIRAIAQDDILRAEIVAVPLTVLILMLVIRTPLSSLIPIVVGMAGVAAAAGLVVAAAQWAAVSIYIMNMIVMLGLAVGIDYTLLVFERYREERRNGLAVGTAIGWSAASAGGSVVISGVSVIIALAAVVFVPISVIRDMALGAIVVVLLGMVAVLMLLPAILRLFGARIGIGQRPTPPDRGPRSLWTRWAGVVTRRPVRSGVVVLLLLGTLAAQVIQFQGGLSYLSLPMVEPDAAGNVDYLEQEVAMTLLSVVEVIVDRSDVPEAGQGIDRLVGSIGGDRDFAPVVTLQTSEDGKVTVIRTLVVRPSGSGEAAGAVERLREEMIPAAFTSDAGDVLVGGPLALQLDVIRIIYTWQPRIIALVLAMSIIALAVAFRSVVVALVATSMTLLSVVASLGVLVLVVQKGIGASLLGVTQAEAIEVWVPLVLFAILFGLSTDYHVFLLGRVQECYRTTGDATGSIAFGIGATGRIICTAAAIMAVVFASFAAGRLVLLQQLGLGLAVAVLIDALLVRLTLVPAIMTVLGHNNWRVPSGPRWQPWTAAIRWRSGASDPAP